MSSLYIIMYYGMGVTNKKIHKKDNKILKNINPITTKKMNFYYSYRLPRLHFLVFQPTNLNILISFFSIINILYMHRIYLEHTPLLYSSRKNRSPDTRIDKYL
jgi:hypothetical protein